MGTLLIGSIQNLSSGLFDLEKTISYTFSRVRISCRIYVIEISLIITRSSRSQMFFKIGVLKNFAMFTGKELC